MFDKIPTQKRGGKRDQENGNQDNLSG